MEKAPSVSCLPAPNAKMSSKAKKVLEEAREIKNPELDLCDRGVAVFDELPGLRKYKFLPNLVACSRQESNVYTVVRQPVVHARCIVCRLVMIFYCS